MSKWNIYSINPNTQQPYVKFVADNLEYHDIWMGEEYVMVTFTSPSPMALEIGDYLVYRDRVYSIYNVPSALKQARVNTYGEAFKYENVKFSSRTMELTDIRFLDIVLGDNLLHYTSLPTFSAYCENVEDLVDRLQANTDRVKDDYGYWFFITPSKDRTLQRIIKWDPEANDNKGAWVPDTDRRRDALKLWNEYFSEYDTVTYDKTNVNVAVDNASVWDGLDLLNKHFALNFITNDKTENRSIIIGASAKHSANIFKYGKGNGLHEIDRIADTEQAVVTRLYSYGSDKNLPAHYYSSLTKQPYVIITGKPIRTTSPYFTWYCLETSLTWDSVKDAFNNNYYVSLRHGLNLIVRTRCWAYAEHEGDTVRPYFEDLGSEWIEFWNNINIGDRVYVTNGVDPDKWPTEYVDHGDLPNNMSLNVLMLPGFPNYPLQHDAQQGINGLCYSRYDDNEKVTKFFLRRTTYDNFSSTPFFVLEGDHEFTFSTDKVRPYITSPNVEQLGVKEGDIHFTEDNDDNGLQDIHPSIEGMTKGDVGLASPTDPDYNERIDEIYDADIITDNGIFAEDATISNFNVTLKNLGFNLKKAYEDAEGAMKLVMKSGHCGGMEFNVKGVTETEEGRWILDIERYPDPVLELYFPYSDAAAHGKTPSANEPYQICSGDRFVLTGILIEDTNYVWAASVELLRKSIIWLSSNDYTRFTYLPKIDEIFMARNKDTAENPEYDTLKAGEMIDFEESDFGINASIYIDQLSIKENGNQDIPTYDIVLREEKQVGRLDRIQNQINNIVSYGTGSGIGQKEVQRLMENWVTPRFLSKVSDDAAAGEIGFLKGLWIKAKGLFGFDEDGNIIANTIAALSGIIDKLQSTNYTSGELTGTGWQLTNDNGEGQSKLEADIIVARTRFIVNELQVRKYVAMGGNYVFSPAASQIERVDYIGYNDELLGYEYVKVPLMARISNAIRMLLKRNNNNRNVMAVSKYVKSLSPVDPSLIKKYRCWIKADDGTTRTINSWEVGMLARCQTSDIVDIKGRVKENEGREETVNNKRAVGNVYYWRKVVEAGQGEMPVDSDGRQHSYIDLSNIIGEYDTGSMAPGAGDDIVCYGATNKKYSHLIVIETTGSDAPAIKEFQGVGLFDDGTQGINWSLNGKQRTKISPTTGNDFYCDHFYIKVGNEEQTLDAFFDMRADKILFGVNGALSNPNLFQGIYNGEDWIKSGYDDSKNIFASINNKVCSPILQLSAGQYVLSFECNSKSANYITIRLVKNATPDDSYKITGADFGKVKEIPFPLSASDIVKIEWEADSDFSLKRPKLETGSRATSWEQGAIGSQIKMTAQQISFGVQSNIEGKLATTGIDITNGLIKLIANKTQFLTSAGVPMIAVQMCDSNGNVWDGNPSTASRYQLPSIVFYNGRIGDTGVTPQWILNYLGFVSATNAGVRYNFTTLTTILSFDIFNPSQEKYNHEGRNTEDDDDIDVAMIASRKFWNSEIVEYLYHFHSGYKIESNGTITYQPGDGINYERYDDGDVNVPRYWLTNTINGAFVPDDGTYSGFPSISNKNPSYCYYMESETKYTGPHPDWNSYSNRAGEIALDDVEPVPHDYERFIVYSLIDFESNGVATIYRDAFVIAMYIGYQKVLGKYVAVIKHSAGRILSDDFDWDSTISISNIKSVIGGGIDELPE